MNECYNCGASEGLHHFETLQCPKGGVESPVDVKQEWVSTTFENAEVRKLELAAPKMYKALQSISNLRHDTSFGNDTEKKNVICDIADKAII